jgi:hypothetical protein
MLTDFFKFWVLEFQERGVQVVTNATAVGDIMMEMTNLLFLILFFQYSTFLEEREYKNTAMNIHRITC